MCKKRLTISIDAESIKKKKKKEGQKVRCFFWSNKIRQKPEWRWDFMKNSILKRRHANI